MRMTLQPIEVVCGGDDCEFIKTLGPPPAKLGRRWFANPGGLFPSRQAALDFAAAHGYEVVEN